MMRPIPGLERYGVAVLFLFAISAFFFGCGQTQKAAESWGAGTEQSGINVNTSGGNSNTDTSNGTSTANNGSNTTITNPSDSSVDDLETDPEVVVIGKGASGDDKAVEMDGPGGDGGGLDLTKILSGPDELNPGAFVIQGLTGAVENADPSMKVCLRRQATEARPRGPWSMAAIDRNGAFAVSLPNVVTGDRVQIGIFSLAYVNCDDIPVRFLVSITVGNTVGSIYFW
jgi:hypothetical protein